ncbi:hypothetical protein Btru_014126 [Bulinus truncatus]|nr:hypothetical protein Btru_014126 [Bulinus truncatus]
MGTARVAVSSLVKACSPVNGYSKSCRLITSEGVQSGEWVPQSGRLITSEGVQSGEWGISERPWWADPARTPVVGKFVYFCLPLAVCLKLIDRSLRVTSPGLEDVTPENCPLAPELGTSYFQPGQEMPIKDRMGDLKQRMQLLDDENQEFGKWTKRKSGDPGQTMQEYLRDASQIEGELVKMKGDVTELRKLQLNLLSTPFQDRAGVTRYESLGERLRLDAARIGASLKQLHRDYEANRRAAPNNAADDGGVFKRVREQQLSTLAVELKSHTDEFFGIQGDYLDRVRSRLRAQLLAKGESVDDLKIGALAGKASYSVFTDNYLADVRTAEQTLRDVEDRNREILALEKSISDMNQLFKDVSLLIANQGDVLDNAEDNIEDADERLERAVGQLGDAVVLKGKVCKKRCWIIAIVGIVVGVVLLVIALTLISE